MELVVAIAAKAAEYTVAPIGRQLGYMIFLKSNTDNLKTKVQLVVETRERVQHRIDAARMNGEEIEFDVQNWLSQVDEMVKAANKFYQKDYYSTTGCSIGRCLNILSRYKQSRTAKKMAQVIIEILDKGNFSTVSFRSLPQLSTATFITKEYKALESRTTTLIQIMEKLKDATIQTIGVWGLGGVGKTTIAKQVAKLADECKLFDRVIMVAVTVNPDVRRIQGEIADALGLRFDEETEMGRANRLCHRIQQENSILIIIDDLWGGFELEAIGVLLGDDHKGSKLFLTSRSYDVLKREMGIQVGFRLEVLPEKEGWILFEEMAGNVVQDPNVQPVAIEVVKRCAGLPVLIATVAKALKDERLYAWKDALKQLETFDKEGMHAKVFSALELSYNQLKGHEIKSLLLLIALHGQPSVRKYDLLIICVGLGLLKNVDTLEDARNRLHKLTNDLKASCLLIEDERDKVIIHDVVREAAVSIAAKDQLFHINFDVEASKEWPEMDQVKIFHGLFLSVRHYHCLPEKLEGPELTSLWLDRNDDSFLSLQHETLLKVPDSFFEEMRKLKVLCVSGMVCTPSPPPSLHLLKNLRALYLYKCSLEDITTIGELANLEILSLQNSEIQQLPREIGQLHRLRLLDLEDCNNLKVIPPKVISNLTHLEELNMKDSFTNWEAEGWNTQCSNASLGELTELCHLTRLYIQVPDTSMVPSDFFLFLENVERFTVRIGQRNYFVNSSQYSRILTISFPSSTHSENLIKILPQEVEYLELDGVNDVKNVLYDFNAKGFPQLKCIWVLNNDDLECVINSMSLNLLGPAFPSLEVLVLENLHNLEHICHGPSTVETFCKLRMVDVEMCNILKNMFSFSMIKALSQLEKIKVSNCKSMKEIVSSEREDNLEPKCMDIKFPELRSLKLQGLPALICFCSKERTSPIFGGTYEEITVDAEIKEIDKADNCSSSLPLFNKKVAFPKLETLKLSSINIEKIWNDQILGSAYIQNLTKLTIKCCGNLKHLLSFPLARDLVNLKYLELSKCQMLEKILATKESFLEEVLFPNLETMKISHMDNLRTMWHHPITPNSFCKVKRIEVSDCPKVTVIFPSDSVSNFQNLETLEVNDCSRVAKIEAYME
ncbi:Disease resistance protein [Quillaja saponaria]|uniref:Disease resistance protein n=1 Tax=Quillaja saponaria TaxID=32244 RepID=A0AAD7PDB8_QUISA|nr:Disease resistance protein [Quillaja saponaria]